MTIRWDPHHPSCQPQWNLIRYTLDCPHHHTVSHTLHVEGEEERKEGRRRKVTAGRID